jgi:hypothetical protein
MSTRSTKTVTISLPPQLMAELDRVSERERRVRSEILRDALRRYIRVEERGRMIPRRPGPHRHLRAKLACDYGNFAVGVPLMRSHREPSRGRASGAKYHGVDRRLRDDRNRAALRRRAPDPVRPSRREQLWDRLAGGDLRNVGFAEFRRLVESFGFRLRRVSGSH